MSKFLTLKHWQVFALLIGVPFILQIVTFSSIIVTKDPKTLTYTFLITTIIYLVLFLSWFYSLGTNLNKKLSKTVKMNLSKFKIFLIIPIIYIFILSIYLSSWNIYKIFYKWTTKSDCLCIYNSYSSFFNVLYFL